MPEQLINKRIAVKVGSQVLCDEHGDGVSIPRLVQYLRQQATVSEYQANENFGNGRETAFNAKARQFAQEQAQMLRKWANEVENISKKEG